MKKEEKIKVLQKMAISFAEELKTIFPEIIGISISGSVAGGYADDYSDIDLDIWLENDDYEKWSKNSPLIEKFNNYKIKKETSSNYTLIRKNRKFDLTLFSIKRTKEAVWRIEQKARRQNSIIVHDQQNMIKNLLTKKILFSLSDNFNDKENDIKLSRDFYPFFIGAYVNYFVPIAIKRKQIEQAHINLDFAINLLLEYVCIKNNKFFPDVKSKWQYASKYLPLSTLAKLREAKLVKSYKVKEIERRRTLLNEVSLELKIPKVKFTNPNLC